MTRSYKQASLALLLVIAFVPTFWRVAPKPDSPFIVPARPAHEGAARSIYQEHFITPGNLTAYTHASTLAELANGDVMAAWYGGTREGADDAAIYQARLNKKTGIWSSARKITDRQQTQVQLNRFIKTLGNPVLFRDRLDRLWLFYVSVSAGGWSGSAINVMTSEDDGRSWGNAKRLIASPFINVSTLVRAAPIELKDGRLALPVYHELAKKFGELLIINHEAKVENKIRIGQSRNSLQPVLAVIDEHDAVAFLRDSGPRPRYILRSETRDGGKHWSPLMPTTLPNPNAGIYTHRLASGELLMVYNHAQRGRHNLSLATSRDNGLNWETLHAFENEQPDRSMRFSYPFLIETQDGLFHLSYTWKKHRIKHITFNLAWLKKKQRQ
ncbi:MAG: exo-alpha-sialidase [Gammaproteobacteria bacterium]|nr:MAG: exo-alpha-sialidase [Gammaproteobacteria bacterium]